MTENTFFCLSGKRVSLYPFEDTELYSSHYLKWMNDIENVKTIGRNDYLLPVSQDKLKEYVHGLDKYKTAFFGIYFIESGVSIKEKMQFVGTFKIYDIDFQSRKASFGIMVGERGLWGKGIASEAIQIASDYCFSTLNFHKLCAGYLESNTGMAKAFKKNGFEVEGVLKDHFYDLEKFHNVVLVGRMSK